MTPDDCFKLRETLQGRFHDNETFRFNIDLVVPVKNGPNTLDNTRACCHSGSHDSKMGNMVKLDHGYGIETVYGHLAKSLVKEGQRVKRGDVVALVGSTGLSTGPHLHYMVKKNGQALDPTKFILD